MKDWLLYLVPVTGLIALMFAYSKAKWVAAQDAGTDRMKEIAGYIQEGAMAFLTREYRVLAVFVVVVAIALGLSRVLAEGGEAKDGLIALAFVSGAVCSGLAGWFGMKVATNANVRTTNAARKGLAGALEVAFSGGTVMGMCVVGLAIGGLGTLLLIFGQFGVIDNMVVDGVYKPAAANHVLQILFGFSLGASSIALFARVGGGIYTKAADVGADLVGKVEAGIPEDDPRNPAVIADNVGDNVGDVAGMGADLFESYIGAIIGAMILGYGMGFDFILLPLVIAAVGILVSIGGTFFVKVQEGDDPQRALNIGTFGAAGVMVPVIFGLSYWLVGDLAGASDAWWKIGVAAVAGLAAGVAVGITTEHYCAVGKKPVNTIAKSSERGAAPNIIAGIAIGFESTALPIIWIGGAILAANWAAGLYGIAIAALGMLCTTGIQLAVDAYGPVADNAGGLAEMAKLPAEVRERTDKLDAVGNTTAAIGKGFAIASAALTALALFAAYKQQAGISTIDITEPKIMVGLFLGGMLPFLFSSMAITAVAEAADAMIDEVRRQFREIPGLLEGTATAEYAKCVDISTEASLKKMMLPGLMAVTVPVIVGFYSKEMLGGLLAGVTVCGVLLALFQSNAGGAWDNAKKFIESGAHGGKGSEAHKASVQGDTVGDPLKDTSGPSLNILVKLMSVVAVVIAPML